MRAIALLRPVGVASGNGSRRSVRRPLASAALLAVLAVAGLQGTASADAADAGLTLSQQTSSGWWAGTPIFDSGNLNGGVNPTGYITFRLFGPYDPYCSAAPLFTSYTAVSGNGYYTSDSFTTNTAGTYHWMSGYSGDANNNPTAPAGCSSAPVYVAKRNVGLSGAASPVTAGVVTDTGILEGGVGPNGPGGTITFALYGPDDMICSRAPVFTSVKAVTANGAYTSDPFTVIAPGKYGWKLTYSGDANNVPQYTQCSDPPNQFTVGSSAPVTSVVAAPSAVRPGGVLTLTWSGIASPTSSDWIGLYRIGSNSPLAWRYSGGTAAGTTTLTVPATAPAGSYEVRLRGAKSGTVTVG